MTTNAFRFCEMVIWESVINEDEDFKYLFVINILGKSQT